MNTPEKEKMVNAEVRQFRRLEMGEIVLATDEIYDDHKREWVEPKWSVGEPAPDPAYTSHRQFRREINSLPNDKWTIHQNKTGMIILPRLILHQSKPCNTQITS
jgi:hypothetical protein